MTSKVLRLLTAAAVVYATAATAVVRAQLQPAPVRLLDVPYVPQSLELCGGAAAAMVMRYWGATGVYAETFAHLVDESAGGIRGADLIEALAGRGWQAVSFAGDPALVQRTLGERRPPIVLIEDRPDRFHYVVIVGWHDGRVVFHDPARAPFRVVEEGAFVRAWGRSGFWTLLALPATDAEGTARSADAWRSYGAEPLPVVGPCGQMVAEGVRLAGTGAVDPAREVLHLASVECPRESAPWRELAGLHAVQKDWGQAAVAARRAVEIDRGDAHAARILATSLFLEGDAAGALDAWNLVGEPRVDLVELRGLTRTRFGIGERALDLGRQEILTSEALRRGGRRLGGIPAVAGARVTYAPAGDGEARITAAVIERPFVPPLGVLVTGSAVRAAVEREARIELGSPMRGGEVWHAAWRWWESRPRMAFGVAAPAPFGGVWKIDAVDERQTYGRDAALFVERHRRVGLGIGDWLTGGLFAEAGVAVEDWADRRALAFSGGGERRMMGDRLIVAGRGVRWTSAAAWRVGATARWRSGTTPAGTAWLIDAGADAVGERAPLAAWPGAGTGHGRDALLRAHPLVRNGAIEGGVIGRRLLHGTIEWRHWSRPARGVARVAPALFVDTARAWRVGGVGDGRAHLDVGAGVRVRLPGTGVLRVDVASGLRDGRVALSAGLDR